ncbi:MULTISPECIES: flagellar biosynthesis anti-sigma factor FlgM [Halomonadaceae]|uniref:Negative regulator of flagellin synthesis n=1 Tax=Vreelandella aquamarina TaxID=77097 RepID=A0A0D7UX08_9GAMM|nr:MULTISPECIES: flagellar biosynthesis anti-sigma factor FlgM [Halomonas]KTG27820.1 flagellar biosynthesis anti-sigma factor FlgM [Idiomarina sp. H105]MCO7242133.1 flagellar biosynthesis anti-sigma factor FlgM [Halomonas sp. Ps84H-12]MCP1304381.1 flagellar biosynthesis anti-sigma factor FlgM [Halomonas sp. R1t8]MCP1316725.1 flagellar biosynthesis anti-sigma factor FlgM [Halomonas sp. 707B3]MCP1330543.1 flagellar biosynthesis anti-sigma factor FlgM [Halomonas sp. R1t4]MEC7295828.1 flagellar b
MKIDNLNPLLRNTPAQQRDDAQKVSEAKQPETGNTTREATQLSQSSIDSSQDIDMAKVQEIRDAIREGRLEVRADRIADGLIANLKDQ